MKRIVYALLATLSGIVLLFSYRTSLDVVQPSDIASPAATGSQSTSGSSGTSESSGSSGSSGTGGSSSGANESSTASGSATTPSGTGLVDGTFTGDAVQTRFGPVQVQIIVSGGNITDVQALQYPNSNGRDRQINEYAIPRLVSETVQSQSAQVHMVSGATYTSGGYQSSLQSAIDQAQQ